jgi:uncharacterized protein (TIGR02099 family)
VLRRIGRLAFNVIPLWSWRLCFYGAVAAIVLVGGIILGLRSWLLPNIEAYRGDVEAALTKAIGQRITIGRISGDWQGWHPRLTLGEVTVYDKADRAALTLHRIDETLSWLSLLYLEPRFYSLEIQRPELEVRRAQDGTYSVAGIELSQTEGRGGLSDWLLRQREVIVRQATIVWIDEQRKAPALRLEQVALRLHNDFLRHRFGLRAVAPEHLAGPIDVRGNFQGGSVRRAREWEGQLFAQLDYTDLAAWKQWVPLPVVIAQGTGALRVWVDVADNRVTGLIADVRLAGLKAQLAGDLRPLDLGALSGRIGWRGWRHGFEVFTQQLFTATADGRELAPIDFSLRRTFARADKPAGGVLKANGLELEPLAEFAEQLPIDAEIRAVLRRHAPRGSVQSLTAAWTGDWPPAQYEIDARFTRIGFDSTDTLPGITNVSGTVELNERRGTLRLANQGTRIELQKMFAEALAFNEIAGQISWTAIGDEYDIRLTGLKFANADLAGTLQGGFQTVSGQPGIADLTGTLIRADARQVARYMPLVVGKKTRDWLRSALISGKLSDARLRLKGALADFPFDRRGKGVFEFTARAKGGVLEYASDWPRIENIAADLTFSGSRMQVQSAGASIMGAQLSRIDALIADLNHTDVMLVINGDAEGPSAEFLRFIGARTVSAKIQRFTKEMNAQGRGRVALKLTIPLHAPQDLRVAGRYQFINNQLRVGPDFPPLEQVNGYLEFTETEVRAAGIKAQIYGGAASIDVANQAGDLTVSASGRANLEQLRADSDFPLNALTGSADWRGSVTVRDKFANMVIESNLQGITSALPIPFAKSADAVMPLRIERQVISEQQDQIDVYLGSVVAASATRRRDGSQMILERIAIGLGIEPPSADGPGVWMRGSLSSLDVDRWRSLAQKSGSGASVLPALAQVDLKIGALDVFGRRFNDFSISGRNQAGRWQSRVSAREFEGEVGWQPQGRGQLRARMARLVLPNAAPRTDNSLEGSAHQPGNFPALEVVVEDFRYKGNALGRLELLAVPEGRDWRIERLNVRSADGNFVADGSWQLQERMQRTQLNVGLDVSDIGKFLLRLGYPEGIRGGNARLNGTLSWSGAPQDIDYPTLAGNLSIETGRGQFVKLKPGIGKLLSILSLQALPRRVALDFKDIFSAGFGFDEIRGTVKLERGVGTTDGFQINGSAAKVVMSGEVDFAQETQKLLVRVTPSVGDSVTTVTTLLGGPIVGIGVFLANKMLNDPLGQIIAYDYSVTGTWSEPTVTKIVIEPFERDME